MGLNLLAVIPLIKDPLQTLAGGLADSFRNVSAGYGDAIRESAKAANTIAGAFADRIRSGGPRTPGM